MLLKETFCGAEISRNVQITNHPTVSHATRCGEKKRESSHACSMRAFRGVFRHTLPMDGRFRFIEVGHEQVKFLGIVYEDLLQLMR